MSIKSQQINMRKLSELLSQDLSYIWGEHESGPNGAKKKFLNVGKVFLRALAKDLGLRDAVVRSNAGGIAVSGDCSLCGMWEESGVFVRIEQPACGGQNVLLFRTVRSLKGHRGGYNNFIRLCELQTMSYEALLQRLGAMRSVWAQAA